MSIWSKIAMLKILYEVQSRNKVCNVILNGYYYLITYINKNKLLIANCRVFIYI